LLPFGSAGSNSVPQNSTMKIGRFEIELLSEGIFDVHKNGDLSKVDASEITSNRRINDLPDESNIVGIDPILVRDQDHAILLDTGLGWGLDAKSSYTETSNLHTNLSIFALKPEDITHVVLSHLHFDHAAGSSYVDTNASTQPTMKNARYYVQKLEWLHAVQQVQNPYRKSGIGYNLDEMYKLYAEGYFELLTTTYYELIPGITLIKTGGHSPGHQIVKIQDDGQTAYYLGDLVPSEYHLNYYAMRLMDHDPIQSKKAKTLILRQALKERATILFYHSIHTKYGKLIQDEERRYALAEVK